MFSPEPDPDPDPGQQLSIHFDPVREAAKRYFLVAQPIRGGEVRAWPLKTPVFKARGKKERK